MDKITISTVQGTIALKRALPQTMKELVIPGSILLSAQGRFGELLYQVVKLPQGMAAYFVLDCTNDVSFTLSRERPFTLLLGTLDQEVNCFFYGLGNIHLPADSFTILLLSRLNAVVHFRKGIRYHCLGLDLDTVYTARLYNGFASLSNFLTLPPERFPAIFSTAPLRFNTQLRLLLADLLVAGTKASLQSRENAIAMTLYYAFKLVEYPTLRDEELRNRLQQLEMLLQEQIHYMPDVKLFASHINQSESTVRKLFKRIYKLPPYTYWQYYRMHHYAARELLETNKKTKDIALALGYSKTTGNFNRKFKQFCKLSPHKYRQLYKIANGKN